MVYQLAASVMDQPFTYDEHSTFHHYDDFFRFPYADHLQPFDATYNAYQPIGGPWLPTNDYIASTIAPSYEGTPFHVQQAHLQLRPGQTTLSQPYLGPVSTGPYGAWNGYPITLDATLPSPHHPEAPTNEVQPVEYSPLSNTEHVPSLSLKRRAVTVEWIINDPIAPTNEVPNPATKRKAIRITPALKENVGNVKATTLSDARQTSSSRSLEDGLGIFDTTLAVAKEKRRRKVFSAQEKNVVKSVRSVGACIQCKFRKKTCGAGNPCSCCARLAGSTALGMRLCHRESPFIDRSMTQYYPSSSRKRILDFHLSTTELSGTSRIIYLDGASPTTRTLCIKVLVVETKMLESSDKARVLRTVEPGHAISEETDALPGVISVIRPGSLSSADLENWAVDYTWHYSSTKLLHATGFIFGVEYAKRGLPHSDLVNKMTRLVSINFVLRTGVIVLSDSQPGTGDDTSPFRTIQAQIDTLLFESFKAIEESLARDLQRLIFRSAGSLARDAIVPVCFCVWQLARLQCLLASHLKNLAVYDVKRSRRSSTSIPAPHGNLSTSSSQDSDEATSHPANTYRARRSEAENLSHGLNLLLCTFEALYRVACPLLLDWSDPFSKELLNNDEEILVLASRMGRTLRTYRNEGHRRRFRLGLGYDEEMSGRIRGLLRER